jgi:Protein of unknown function (DUF4038)/Putative collagen-binding domain of a collagenase
VTIVALPVRAMLEESRQSLFETGREVGKRDKAVLALSPLYPSASAPTCAPVEGAEECEPQAGRRSLQTGENNKETMRPQPRILARLWLGILLISLFSGQGFKRTWAASAYPLKAGPTGCYLVDQNNQPFLINGDSVDALLARLLPADADMYYANRQSNGFNVVWFQVLTDKGYSGRDNGSTPDGIVPFTASRDFSTPNEAHFARLDDYVNRAAGHGLTTILDPLETGGLIQALRKNGAVNAFNFGAYLGNRYKNFKNIVWVTGNDYKINAGDDALMAAVIKGIKSADSNHLHTSENYSDISAGGQTSLDDASIGWLLDFNGAYVWTATYLSMCHAYHQSSIPAYLHEGNFEQATWGGEFGTPQVLRRQAYWATLSGGVGQIYGHKVVVWFLSGWQSNLNTPGVTQSIIGRTSSRDGHGTTSYLMRRIRWLPRGYGTLGNASIKASASDYLTAARTPDGSLVVAYTSTAHTFTVDMTKLSGPAAAQWFDPANGIYKMVQGSSFANAGRHQFTSPGANNAGHSDCVLLLEVRAEPVGLTTATTPGSRSALRMYGPLPKTETNVVELIP